ncbi:S-adenosyl-L-methionine-dependent methyltransferase [Podospora conica]|nr:S-adenosyl-L-methionine-dependent methyltransferase [Schizothecium conicum]
MASEQAASPKAKGKRPHQGGPGNKGNPSKFRKKQQKAPAAEGTHEQVLLADIQAMLASQKISDDTPSGEDAETETTTAATEAEETLPEQGTEIEVDVVQISSTGEGLAQQKGSKNIYVVPFSVPGDTVRVKVYRHLRKEGYTVADFISVVTPSPLRDDSRIQCQYFTKCAGCQFQMLDYAEQLRLKRDIVVKAYRNFSQLPPELVPSVLDTMGSPLQYGYRTKLTPHFDGPPGSRGRSRGPKKPLASCPPIGFTPKTTSRVLDIEDCPIATDAVRAGLRSERARMETEYPAYTKGATILLRESTQRVPNPPPADFVPPPSAIAVPSADHTDYKTCITDNNATSTEYVDNLVFTNPAGAFFQNNNSILSPFSAYIREHMLPPPSAGGKAIRTLIDAYSGSGLFTITQAALFPGGSVGIDIEPKSIAFARRNAELNGLAPSQCKFIAADAPELFKSVAGLDADETVVVLDPPRRGCDASFLSQLLTFAPRRVVYVSCNVHTQARDVGVLVRGAEGGGARYEIESLRGFDFFPQTGHVEGVAVLNRVDGGAV